MTDKRAQDIIGEIMVECDKHSESCTGCPFNKTDNKYSVDCIFDGKPYDWRWESE